MAAFQPANNTDAARYCIEQAKILLRSACSMWFRACESVEATKKKRATLHAQIEELASRSAFSQQFKTTLLAGILEAAIEGTAADMGNIQVFDPKTCQLVIYLHCGFQDPFLKFFNSVHVGQAACGAALKSCARVIVPDIANSRIFSKREVLETMLDAGVRAVQSTPIVGKSGRVWGMLSTHSRTPDYPGKKDLPLIDYLAEWAAGILAADGRAAHSRHRPSVESFNGHSSHRRPFPASLHNGC